MMKQTRFTEMVGRLRALAVGNGYADGTPNFSVLGSYTDLEKRAEAILSFDRMEITRYADRASDRLFGGIRAAAAELRGAATSSAWRSLLTQSLAQWCELARTSSEGTLPVEQPVVMTQTVVVTGTRDALSRAGYSLEEINTPRDMTTVADMRDKRTRTLQRTVRPVETASQGLGQAVALNPDWFKILSQPSIYPLSLLPPRR